MFANLESLSWSDQYSKGLDDQSSSKVAGTSINVVKLNEQENKICILEYWQNSIKKKRVDCQNYRA